MSRRAIRAGRAEIYVGLNDSALERGWRSIETRMNAASEMIGSVGKKLVAAGGATAGALTPVIFAASDFQESFSKFQVVFGENTIAVKKWSDDLAWRLGRSKLQIVDFMASSQDLFIPLGFDDANATKLSKTITQLSIDLASFNNRADADVMRDIQAALTGSGEVMKKYGVIVNESAVKQELLNQGIKKSEATNAQKVQARLNIIMRGTVAAQGDAIRTSREFANMMKRLKGIVVDFSTTAGTPLLDVLATLSGTTGEVIRAGEEYIEQNRDLVLGVALASVMLITLGSSLLAAGVGLQMLGTASTIVAASIRTFWMVLNAVKIATAAVTTAWIVVQAVLWAATIATVAAYKAVSIYGVRTIVAKTATMAWTATVVSARVAMALATNIVTLATVAIGVYRIATNAATISTALMNGNLIKAALAGRALAVSSVSVAGAIGLASAASKAAAAVQGAVSSAFGLATGAISMGTIASGVSASSAGFLSGAWATAAGVIATAYGIITSPVSLIVAGIIAIASAFIVVAGVIAAFHVGAEEFGRAWGYVQGVLSKLLTIAKETFGGIKDALAAGQYMLAAKILWAGIKQAFWLGVKEVISIFRSLPSTVMRVLKNFTKNFLETLWKLFSSVPQMIKNALTGKKTLSESIKAILGTGDWLEGLATNKMISARNELSALRGEAKKFREERDKSKAVKEATSQLDSELGGTDSDAARRQAIADKHQQLKQDRLRHAQLGNVDQVREIDAQIEKLKEIEAREGVGGFVSEKDAAKDADFVSGRIDRLEQEIRALELGAEEAEIYQLQQRGATQADVEAYRALMDRKRALEESKKAEEAAKEALLDRIAKAGENAFENGASPSRIFDVQSKEIDKQVARGRLTKDEGSDAKKELAGERDQRQESRAADADAIRESLKSPLDKFNDEVKKIVSFVDSGDLTKAEGAAAIAKERKDFVEENRGPERADLGIAELGSREALQTINRTLGVGTDGAAEVPSWVNPLTNGINQQVQAAAALPAQIAASMVSATQTAIDTKKLEEIATQQLTETQKMPGLLRQIANNTRTADSEDEL